jgi:hypothetical protein
VFYPGTSIFKSTFKSKILPESRQGVIQALNTPLPDYAVLGAAAYGLPDLFFRILRKLHYLNDPCLLIYSKDSGT